MDRITLTIPEAARLLGIGRSAAYEAAKTGDIPTAKFGRRIVVPLAKLERLLGLQEGVLNLQIIAQGYGKPPESDVDSTNAASP